MNWSRAVRRLVDNTCSVPDARFRSGGFPFRAKKSFDIRDGDDKLVEIRKEVTSMAKKKAKKAKKAARKKK